ncbi:Ribokinase-like protein, partial [Protomyces lactucae-debilis]
RILSIQSSVVHGYVGNRSATFPLQLHGYDVACLNTVQFSTHTGYPSIHGSKLPAEEIRALYTGLEVNGAVETIAGLLTGYVPGADGILAIKDIAASIRASSPTPALWVLDPVMGDEERGMYVSEEIPPLYKELITHADVITPNQFELGVLAGMEITGVDSLRKALDTVHTERGIRRIVVTTFRKDEGTIWVVGSDSASSTPPNIATQFAVEVPYSDCPFQGTGDLFAALLLARL